MAKGTLNLQTLVEKNNHRKKSIFTIPTFSKSPRKIRLGVAKDKAFCFYYSQNLNLLEAEGAELVNFSPLEEKKLPEGLSGLYFGGGYPEIFAKQLTENTTLKSEILNAAYRGLPIYAECGGLIYLSEKILFEDGSSYPMVGIFPYTIKWKKNYLAIRYVEIKTIRDTILGPKGSIVKGQEFHQTQILNPPEKLDFCYEVTSSTNENFSEGYKVNNTLASYLHLYFPSAKQIPKHFISQCEKYQQEKYAYSCI